MQAPYVLIVKCPDRKGIFAAVSAFLLGEGGSILQSNQFNEDGLFFMRTVFGGEDAPLAPIQDFREKFRPIAEKFAMSAEFRDSGEIPRVLIAVSKFGHCLYDLLHRWRSGLLPVEIAGVVSNHDDMRSFVEWNNLPYYYMPVAKGGKQLQEGQVLDLVDLLKVNLVVLARYMQILSPDLCEALAGRCINIHHSFLPSFKGAKPYHQAHARGVKMIGATAHYVTTDLDEGPIIAQDARHVTHAFRPDQLVALGQEVECAVLSRAVKWHAEHRVLINGQKTIVFD